MLASLVLLAEAQDPARPAGGLMDAMFLPLALLAAFLFFIVMPMRRDARVRKQMLGALKKNDRVIINGFMIGQVVQIIESNVPRGEDELLVKIDENASVKMRVLRSSVTRILANSETAKDAKEGS
ncbi:MAG: preprotein translocase subunit YajC [Gemmataceae bacterium]